MKKILLIIVFIPCFIFSQTETIRDSKKISGYVTYKNEPLPNTAILINGTNRSTISNEKGFYTIEGNAGDTLEFNHIGFKKIAILLEDATNVLNIKLSFNDNSPEIKQDDIVKLGGSSIGDEYIDFELMQIDVDSLNKNAPSLTDALLEKLPIFFARKNKYNETILYLKGNELNGPVVWQIDDVFYDIPLPIYMSEVKKVIIFNYNLDQCIIVVNTTIDYKKIKDYNYENHYFTDEEYYNDDAILYKKVKKTAFKYLKNYKKLKKSEEAFKIYATENSNYKNNSNYYANLITYFLAKKSFTDFVLKILKDYEVFAKNNPELLKNIAYKYDEINLKEKALELYKKIANIRPAHAQSYRDLANAYLELNDRSGFWRIYNSYFQKKNKIDENDIEDIISSEIMTNYKIDKDEQNKVRIINVENTLKNSDSDIRLVFEWNTTEAEFILEFINPEKEVFKMENSLEKNTNLIIDQKTKGYTSKEIFINTLKKGNYLVNLTYLGNKQNKPTIFKVTSFYNWGRPNQSKKINTYDFTLENVKTQLLKINRKLLK